MNISNAYALDLIARLLSGQEWSSETLDTIARIMRLAGYQIDDIDTEDEQP